MRGVSGETICDFSLLKIRFVDNVDEILSEFQNRQIEFADTLKIHGYGLKEFAFMHINGYYIHVAERCSKE